MEIIVRKSALRDLDAIFDWISRDNPPAARRTLMRIQHRINRLAASGLPRSGRPGPIDGTRELVEPTYVIVYRVDDDGNVIVVLAVLHQARERLPGRGDG